MSHHSRTALASGALLAAALWLLSGCGEARSAGPSARYGTSSSHSLLAGTLIPVALAGDLSSETASAGDAWHGTVTENVRTLNGLIAAGSEVQGVVVNAIAAAPGMPAMLELGVRSVRVNGRDEPIAASTEAMIPESPRTRSLAAINGEGGGEKSKGDDAVLFDGVVLGFTVSRTVAIR